MEECGKVLLPNLGTPGAQATNRAATYLGTAQRSILPLTFQDLQLGSFASGFRRGISGSAALRSDRGPTLLKPRHWKAIPENMGHSKEQQPVTLDVGWQREKNKSGFWTHVDTIRIHEFLGGG